MLEVAHAKQFALVPLQAGSLVGQERLAALVCGPDCLVEHG